MFKLVVLCAFLAAAGAEPGAFFATAPHLTYSSVLSPATTTITKHASSVVHPSSFYYSAPLAYSHFIKKRSAPLALTSSYFAPTTYLTSAHVAAPAIVTPYLHAPVYSSSHFAYTAPAHFIKKRSVALALPSTYIAPTTYAAHHLLTPYTSATHVLPAAPLISSLPISYPHFSHYIKKRSAPLFASTYLAPTSYSSQSRIDVHHSAPLYTSYSSPLVYTHPIAYPHLV